MSLSPLRERRDLSSESGPVSQGIIRVEQNFLKLLSNHDTWWRKMPNRGGWLTEYSLLDHSAHLAKVVVAAAQYLNWNDETVRLLSFCAWMHDTGKMDRLCRPYRLNRTLTVVERHAVDYHPYVSGRYLFKHLPRVRLADRPFLQRSYPIILRHHAPWLVGDLTLRRAAFLLHVADMFVAMMEKRHRPGLSQFQALEAIEEYAGTRLEEKTMRPFAAEFEMALDVLRLLYGVDKVTLLPNLPPR